jgi:hypothetical protein
MVTTVAAMTFTNKRRNTRGNQAEAETAASNMDTGYGSNGNREQLQEQQQQRRSSRRAHMYNQQKDKENCPWSADQTIQHHMFTVFESPTIAPSYMTQAQRRKQREKQAVAVSYPALDVMFPQSPQLPKHSRHLEDQAAADDAYAAADDAYAAADDANANDEYYAGDDDDANNNNNNKNNDDNSSGRSYDDDVFMGDNEMCSQFLVNFLEGTTDARDTCEGIQNAYVAAGTLHLPLFENCTEYEYSTY